MALLPVVLKALSCSQSNICLTCSSEFLDHGGTITVRCNDSKVQSTDLRTNLEVILLMIPVEVPLRC